MRVLKINDVTADIDSSTAIGVDFEAWDPSDPGKQRVDSSNTFTIPLTTTNRSIFGFADDPQSGGDEVYDEVLVSYWADGARLLYKAVGRVTEMSDRITLLCYQKDNFWTTLGDRTLGDLGGSFLAYLYSNYGVPIAGYPSTSFASMISNYRSLVTPANGVCVPYMLSNFRYYNDLEFGFNDLYLSYYNSDDDEVYYGAHWCLYTRSLLKFLESSLNVDLHLDDTGVTGSLWADTNAYNSFFLMPNLVLNQSYDSGTSTRSIWFKFNEDATFEPNGESSSLDIGLLDWLKIFMQTFNVITNQYYDDNNKLHIEMYKFDDIESADMLDWSGKLDAATKPKFKPLISGYGQKSYIYYSSVYTGATEYKGAKVIECSNVNLDATAELFSIDSYYPPNIAITSTVGIENLVESEALNKIMFFVQGSTAFANSVTFHLETGSSANNLIVTTAATPALSKFYAVANEYNTLATLADKPKVYEAKLWLSPKDVESLTAFHLVYIKELRGAFFVTKVKGYNPSMSKEATTVYLLKVSDITPSTL